MSKKQKRPAPLPERATQQADRDYKTDYEKLAALQKDLHRQNQKNIQNGIKCIIFIPLLFLALVFLTHSGRVIFLMLWIVSMFFISAYLIYIEYIDFQVQELVAAICRTEIPEKQALIGENIDAFENSALEILREWEDSMPPGKKMEDLFRMRCLVQQKKQKKKKHPASLSEKPEKKEKKKTKKKKGR